MQGSKKAKSLFKGFLHKQWVSHQNVTPSFKWDERRRSWHIDSLAGKIVCKCRKDAKKAARVKKKTTKQKLKMLAEHGKYLEQEGMELFWTVEALIAKKGKLTKKDITEIDKLYKRYGG